jgi:hypothetical protein
MTLLLLLDARSDPKESLTLERKERRAPMDDYDDDDEDEDEFEDEEDQTSLNGEGRFVLKGERRGRCDDHFLFFFIQT